MLLVLQPLAIPQATTALLVPSFFDVVTTLAPVILAWAWMLIAFLSLWLMWILFRFMKLLDWLAAIKFTVLQVTLPEDAEVTPKSMENAIALWGGLHKNPDVMEKYFEGYTEWWYSLEVQCTAERVKYFLFIPEVHRQFFEGVLYGQYPEVQIREAPDYALRYDYKKIRQEFEVYGTDMVLGKSDVYPIRTYAQYDDPLSPSDTFIDPHQALIEAYSNVKPGEEYWFQVLVWPKGGDYNASWVKKGEKEIKKIRKEEEDEEDGFFKRLFSFFAKFPADVINTMLGKEGGGGGAEYPSMHLFDPVETAKMEGILHKISREAYHTMVRVIYIAPKGKLHKPNVGRAIGGFKQFNTFNLNGFKPNPGTKSNGVDYIMKERRRHFRERQILGFYQWRVPETADGVRMMMNSEEIATLFHLPGKWVKAPVLERAKSGKYSAPENVPYV